SGGDRQEGKTAQLDSVITKPGGLPLADRRVLGCQTQGARQDDFTVWTAIMLAKTPTNLV
ncbi:MAG: hypothetical protein RR320_00805, partial [Oscillospiraceae bacterium]